MPIKAIFAKYSSAIKLDIRHLERIYHKLAVIPVKIQFLKTCKRRNSIPISFRLKRKWVMNRKENAILRSAELQLLEIAIQESYTEIATLKAGESELFVHLLASMANVDFIEVLKQCDMKAVRSAKVTKENLDKKLLRLKSKPLSKEGGLSKPRCVSQASNFVNISRTQLTAEQADVLNLGSAYALSNPRIITTDNVAKLNSLTRLDDEKRQKIIIELDSLGKAERQPSTDSDNIKIINQLKMDRNIHLCTADKGGKIVVMDRNEYDEKLAEIIHDKYTVINKDPTTICNTKLRQYLKREVGWSDREVGKYAPTYPKPPSIYGQPKVHKEGNPLRPIVSQKNTVYSNISRFISKNLFDLLPRPKSHIKNGGQFAKKCAEHFQDNNEDTPVLFASLDVVEMFGSIEPQLAIQVLTRRLDEIPEADFRTKMNMTKNQCIEIVGMTLKNAYFNHKGEFYTQTQGLAMGSSLSPLLADLVLQDIETNIQNQYAGLIKFWYRYVDDIILAFLGNKQQLKDLFSRINDINTKIQFTLEMEVNDRLNYLDVTVHRINNRIETHIYTKPTGGDGLIPFKSDHTYQTKISVARQKLARITEICSNKPRMIEEKRKLRHSLEEHQYDKAAINAIFKTKSQSQQQPKQKVRYVTFEFQQKLKKPISKLVKSDKWSVAWTQKNKIVDLYKRPNNVHQNLKTKHAVYVIPCSCGKIYIGETMRPVFIRIKEHKAYVKRCNMNSHIYRHLKDHPDHQIIWDNSFIVDHEDNLTLRKQKEAIYIHLNPNSCISDITSDVKHDWLWLCDKHKKKVKYKGVEVFVI